jgi:hypothetical protein
LQVKVKGALADEVVVAAILGRDGILPLGSLAWLAVLQAARPVRTEIEAMIMGAGVLLEKKVLT